MTDVKHTAGDWAVWNDAGWLSAPRYETRRIEKVTEKTFSTEAIYNETRQQRRDIDAILWSGPEDEAKNLTEILNSSVGLMKDEIRSSKERNAERVRSAILRATGGSASPTEVGSHGQAARVLASTEGLK